MLPEYPILLVEDNLDDILITKRAMAKGKISNKLFVVHDGEEALEFFKKQGKYKDAPTPTLVLLDLKMPKLDGFGVLKAVKSDETLKSIPIIVLTSSERDKDVDLAYKLGANNYIMKPVSFDNFIETILSIKYYWLTISKIPMP
jgi:two-component system response regulator